MVSFKKITTKAVAGAAGAVLAVSLFPAAAMAQTGDAAQSGAPEAAPLAVQGELSAQAGGGKTYPTAEKLKFGKDTYGKTRGGDAESYYYFKTDKQGGVKYKVSYVNLNSSAGRLDFCVRDSDYQYVASENYVNGGEGGTISDLSLRPSKKYYVTVCNGGRWDGDDDDGKHPYLIRVNRIVQKPSAGMLKSVTGGKGKVTVKYYRMQYGNKYQVALKKAGSSWKKFDNGKKLSRSFKNLKKGKYKAKVRACRNFNGKWYYGAWSEARSVKVR